MLALIRLQDVMESWANAERLQALRKVTVSCPRALTRNQVAFATTFAITVLRVRFNDRKNKWLMISRKALLWFNNQAIDAEAVITELIGELHLGRTEHVSVRNHPMHRKRFGVVAWCRWQLQCDFLGDIGVHFHDKRTLCDEQVYECDLEDQVLAGSNNYEQSVLQQLQ
jgi:hypothetical protein